MIAGNRVRDVLQHDGFARFWRRDEQTALAFANRSHDINDAAGNVFFGLDVALKAQYFVREQWREVFKQHLVLASLGRVAVDAVEFGQREVALTFFRRTHFAVDRVARV